MSINGDNWEIIYIPAKPPISPYHQPTVNVFASVIDRKFANVLVRKLNQIAPLEQLRHVKRVQKRHLEGGETQLSVILCLADEDDGEPRTMPQDVLELVKSYRLSVFKTKVCKYPATSKEEWEQQCKLWPTSFHPPTYNIEGISGFSEDDSRRVFSFMTVSLELAKSRRGQVVNAAVIVDPSTSQIISSACDGTYTWDGSPNQRSIKLSSCPRVEPLVSHPSADVSASSEKLHSNGAPFDPEKHSTVSCLNPWGWHQEQPYSPSYWHPLRHAALVALEDSAARDRHLFPGTGNYDESILPDVLYVSASSPSKKQKTSSDEEVNEENGPSKSIDPKADRPYLCTGYDMYLAWEPCIMCAMAIIHQRVRRVFYAFPNPNAGALGSVHRLQGERSLNHHYAVFRVKLPDKAPDRAGVLISKTAEHE